MISWLVYLALTGASPASQRVLVQTERLSQGLEVLPDNENIKPVAPNEAFAELDQLLESKVALQKNYVSKVKFTAAVVKQTQLLAEKIPVDGPATDFWIRAYGPTASRPLPKPTTTIYPAARLPSATLRAKFFAAWPIIKD